MSKFPVSELAEDQLNDESRELGFYLQKGLFEEYAWFGRGHGHDLAPFDDYHKARGLRWPVVNGKETQWRYSEGNDPYVKAGEGYKFYGKPDGKAVISRCRSNRRRKHRMKSTTCGSLPDASGALAYRQYDSPCTGTAPRLP